MQIMRAQVEQQSRVWVYGSVEQDTGVILPLYQCFTVNHITAHGISLGRDVKED